MTTSEHADQIIIAAYAKTAADQSRAYSYDPEVAEGIKKSQKTLAERAVNISIPNEVWSDLIGHWTRLHRFSDNQESLDSMFGQPDTEDYRAKARDTLVWYIEYSSRKTFA